MNINSPKGAAEVPPVLKNKTNILAAVVLAITSQISGCAAQYASSSQTVRVNGDGEPEVTCASSGNGGNVNSTTTVNGKTYKCPKD